MAAILNSTILESAILVFCLKLTHTCQDWFPPFAQKKLHSHFPPHHLHKKKNFTHSFSVNLIMATILNSAILDSDTDILDSDTLLSSLRFTQKHSLSNLNLTQTNSFWLTWWWQQSWILPSWFWPFCTKKMSLIHSDFTWWWQPSWILPTWIQPLPFWIQTPCYLVSDSLKNTLPPLWLWLKLIQSDSNSFVLTQLDYGSHLEFYHLELGHLGIGHLGFSSQTHSHLPRLVYHRLHKKTFTHSFSLNLMMTAMLNSAMLD